MELRPYQREAVEAIEGEWESGRRSTLLVLPTGCHHPNQGILMADGTVKRARDVAIGDRLMGDDGTPRTVLCLHSGRDEMYKVSPLKGLPFAVTHDHVLSLVQTNLSSDPKYPSESTGGTVKDVTVDDYLGWSKTQKHIHKLYRSEAIERFEGNDGSETTVDPYFLGVLLGDGALNGLIAITTMDNEVVDEIERQAEKYEMTLRTEPAGKATTYFMKSGKPGCKPHGLRGELIDLGISGQTAGEKHVPRYYKTLPIAQRKQVIAGLIDTDGSLSSTCGYDFVSKSMQLSEDLAFMCRSIGLAAYMKPSVKSSQSGFTDVYYRVSISGDCSIIPCRVAHKKSMPRRQIKNVLRTGFTVEHIGVGSYFGFTVDGNNRYLMDDFTVTHNCGKTIVFATVMGDMARRGKRSLVLAHRGELLDQAAAKVREVTGMYCSVEKADQTCVGSWSFSTVGSVQTLMRDKRLEAIEPRRFDVIVVDEAHHALADSYRKVLDHFPNAKILGVTATPDRADRRNLGAVFDSLAYEYTMPQAIRDGYLCPIEAQTVPLDIDITSVKQSNGDYALGDLGTALDPYLEAIADEMIAAGCADRRTVVFLPLVATSKKFRAILESKGFSAAEVNGESDDRAEVLADFSAGKYQVLCNSMLLTEGWDCPSVDCIVVLRATRSRSLYCQMIGRGCRLSPETGKTHLLLLDFLWHTTTHELCRPAYLIAESDEIARAMTKRLEQSGEPMELEEVERKARGDVVREREERLAEELKAMRKRRRQLVDPLQFEMSIAAEDLSAYVPSFGWEMAPMSDAQRSALEHFGIFPDEVECAGKASMLLDRLSIRRGEGLTSPKQIRLLERYGFQHVGTWQLEDASRLIKRIQANGWHVPHGIDPATYQPGGVAA